MKNTNAIFTDYLPGKFTSRTATVAGECEIVPNSFKPMRKRIALISNAALLLFFALLLTGSQAKAASFSVNLATDASDFNPGDTVCDTNVLALGAQCTLRAAIQEANALGGIDDISFSLSLPASIELTNGELHVTGSVAINGPGARSLTVERAAAAPNFRIFYIETVNGSVAISGLTIANGKSIGDHNLVFGGGGISNFSQNGTLTLTAVTVRNNTTSGNGGGIQNIQGNLNVIRSTIHGNTAVQGGGINNLSNNVVTNVLNMSNSTVSGNIATTRDNIIGEGGGILNGSAAALNNVTVFNNQAAKTGGVYNRSQATINLRNTIVAGNVSGGSYPMDVEGAFTSLGNNLIGRSNGSTGFSNNANGDKVGTDDAPLNPQIEALQDYGGQTDTHRLLPGSPAIDAGNGCVADPFPSGCLPAALTTDQRGAGFTRKLDGDGNGSAIVDIGAYEAVTMPTAASLTVGGRVITAHGRGIKNVIVTITFPSGEQRTAISGSFGYYRFADIPAGASYVFSVAAKRYTFAQSSQLRNLSEETQDIDFIADAPGYAHAKTVLR